MCEPAPSAAAASMPQHLAPPRRRGRRVFDQFFEAIPRDMTPEDERPSKALGVSPIENVSVGEVMKAAGLTHGAFYARFGSKQELQEAAMGRKHLPMDLVPHPI